MISSDFSCDFPHDFNRRNQDHRRSPVSNQPTPTANSNPIPGETIAGPGSEQDERSGRRRKRKEYVALRSDGGEFLGDVDVEPRKIVKTVAGVEALDGTEMVNSEFARNVD